MIVQIYSDLHITKNKFLPELYKYCDYLILNGDIGKLSDKNYQKFIKYVSKTWKMTLKPFKSNFTNSFPLRS